MLSVIMPARNEEAFIAAALRSVVTQSLDLPLDVVVIDDGSTDGTAAIVQAFIEKGAPVRLISGPAQGVSAARNAGLASLSDKTRFVTFLDADDMFPPGRLARDLACFQSDPTLEVVYGRLRLVEAELPDMESAQKISDSILLGISMSCGIFTRETLLRTGIFDTSYEMSEDLDFLLRLFERRPNTRVVEDVSILYRQHAGNTIKRVRELRRSFMRALLDHSKRRKANPDLHSVDWIWAQQNGLGGGLAKPALAAPAGECDSLGPEKGQE